MTTFLKAVLVLAALVPTAVLADAQPDVSTRMKALDAESHRFLVKVYAQQNADQQKEAQSSTGSGELVRNQEGIVRLLTNAHVVGDASTVMVHFEKERFAQEVTVLGVDKVVDLALLEAPRPLSPSSRPLAIARSPVRIGDVVFAIGYPSGSRTITSGSVNSQTSFAAQSGISILFTHQAPIMPGSSGGALIRFNDSGVPELVGINTLVATSGRAIANLGFSINSRTIVRVMAKLESERYVSHAYAGLVLTDDSKANPYLLMQAIGSYPPSRSGVIVTSVVNNMPAARAGILPGDAIKKFEVYTEGQWFEIPFETASDLSESLFFDIPPGTRVRFTTNRGAQDIGREFLLETYPTPKPERQ